MADRRRKPPRKDRRGVAPLTAAVVFLVIAIVAIYLGFTKHVPFTHGFRVKAVVESANSLRKASFVRIAGVQVGQVKKVEPFGDGKMAVITMELKKNGLFLVPGFAKFVVIKKPATKARKGTNPFTGEEMMFKAKPARKIVRARPVKAAKDAVG